MAGVGFLSEGAVVGDVLQKAVFELVVDAHEVVGAPEARADATLDATVGGDARVHRVGEVGAVHRVVGAHAREATEHGRLRGRGVAEKVGAADVAGPAPATLGVDEKRSHVVDHGSELAVTMKPAVGLITCGT